MSYSNVWTSWSLSLPKTVVAPQQRKRCLCFFDASHADSDSSMRSFDLDGSGHNTRASLAKLPTSFGNDGGTSSMER